MKLFDILFCKHEYNTWHLVIETLVSWMGTTKEEVQQRECTKCGHIQRRKIERV